MNKKIRFEVFKRDGFKCAYCGKSPPAVLLEVDHIEPKSRGGKDDINNYITACFDCNRGKSNIPLDKAPPKLQDNLDVLKEKEAQLKQYRKFVAKIEDRMLADIEEVNAIYEKQYSGWTLSETFKNVSVRRFLQLLPKHLVIESMLISISRFPTNSSKVIRYFCGVCWNKIKGTEP